MLNGLENCNLNLISKNLFNAFAFCWDFEEMTAPFKGFPFVGVFLSGSGPTVGAVFENKADAQKCGAALKEKGTKHWETTSDDVKDEYNFGIVGAGFRDPYGNFTWKTVDACFWSATGKTPSYAWYRHTFHYDKALSRHEVQKCNGYSVRCVKNN